MTSPSKRVKAELNNITESAFRFGKVVKKTVKTFGANMTPGDRYVLESAVQNLFCRFDPTRPINTCALEDIVNMWWWHQINAEEQETIVQQLFPDHTVEGFLQFHELDKLRASFIAKHARGEIVFDRLLRAAVEYQTSEVEVVPDYNMEDAQNSLDAWWDKKPE